jgi:transcriptional regulator with XRE-family HTH domain
VRSGVTGPIGNNQRYTRSGIPQICETLYRKVQIDERTGRDRLRRVTRRTSPTVKRRRVAATLKLLRERTGMTAAQAARQVDHDQSWLSRIESLQQGIHPNDVRALLAVYGVTGDAAGGVVDLARQARQRGWWHTYGDAVPDKFSTFVGLESDASGIRAFGPQTVPGLLQTADYARATITAATAVRRPEEVDQWVAMRIDRQELLDGDDPPHLRVVLDEATLRRTIGGPQVMRGQLERLLQVSERSHIDVRVLPFDAGAHAGLTGAFVIFDFPPPPEPYPHPVDDGIVHIDTRHGPLYVDQPADVAAYAGVFKRVYAAAVSAARSRDLLRGIVKDLTG